MNYREPRFCLEVTQTGMVNGHHFNVIRLRFLTFEAEECAHSAAVAKEKLAGKFGEWLRKELASYSSPLPELASCS